MNTDITISERTKVKRALESIYIRTVKGKLTVRERLTYNVLVSAAQAIVSKDGDIGNNFFEAPLQPLMAVLGMKRYQMEQAFEGLQDTKVKYDIQNKGGSRWGKGAMYLVSEVQIPDDDKDVVRFAFPPTIHEMVVSPKERYSQIPLGVMAGLSSKYAIAIYEVLTTLVGRKHPEKKLSVDELCGILGLPEGKPMSYIRRRAIDPAISELQDKVQEIGFEVMAPTFNKGGRGGKVHSVTFAINWEKYDNYTLRGVCPDWLIEAFEERYPAAKADVHEIWLAFSAYVDSYKITVTRTSVQETFLGFAGIHVRDNRKNALGHVSPDAVFRVKESHKGYLDYMREDAVLAAWQLSVAYLENMWAFTHKPEFKDALDFVENDADEAYTRFVRKQVQQRWPILAEVQWDLPDSPDGFGAYLRTPYGDNPEQYVHEIKHKTKMFRDEAKARMSNDSEVSERQTFEHTTNVAPNPKRMGLERAVDFVREIFGAESGYEVIECTSDPEKGAVLLKWRMVDVDLIGEEDPEDIFNRIAHHIAPQRLIAEEITDDNC